MSNSTKDNKLNKKKSSLTVKGGKSKAANEEIKQEVKKEEEKVEATVDKKEEIKEVSNDDKADRVVRRIRIGDKLTQCYNWPMITFDELESPCSIQEYLQSLIRKDSSDINLLITIPEHQSPDIWLYEHLRQVCLELSYLVVELQLECTSITCAEMKASEWFYLCASHTSPQGCCAIDYIVHTLDNATSLLNSTKYFPSRISIPSGSIKHFLSIARRIYRIFAHSFYHHKILFDKFESHSHLYQRFLGLTEHFSLIPPSLINIPFTNPTPTLNVNLNPNLKFADDDKDNQNEPLLRSDTVLRKDEVQSKM